MNADSGGPAKMRLALPPVNTIRASGKRRASAAISVTRSAPPLSETMPRATERSGSMAPPNTMMPSGGVPDDDPRRETLLEQQHQNLSGRQNSKDRHQRKARDKQTPARTGKARPEQDEAANRQQRDQMRRDGQNAERLGQDEEHRCRDPLASPLPACGAGRKTRRSRSPGFGAAQAAGRLTRKFSGRR